MRNTKFGKLPRLPNLTSIEHVKLELPFSGTIGIAIFDGMEDLDFAGPWEVLRAATARGGGKVVSIGRTTGAIQTTWGLQLTPNHAIADAPKLDVLLVPGGSGAYAIDDTVVAWIAATGAKCRWVTSVCTGAFVLQRAGFLAGKRATTYWGATASLRSLGVDVLEGVRFVRDGKVVTSAGVSAGIDMALWLVGRLYHPAFARSVQKYIEYYPAPPYAWDE